MTIYVEKKYSKIVYVEYLKYGPKYKSYINEICGRAIFFSNKAKLRHNIAEEEKRNRAEERIKRRFAQKRIETELNREEKNILQ